MDDARMARRRGPSGGGAVLWALAFRDGTFALDAPSAVSRVTARRRGGEKGGLAPLFIGVRDEVHLGAVRPDHRLPAEVRPRFPNGGEWQRPSTTWDARSNSTCASSATGRRRRRPAPSSGGPYPARAAPCHAPLTHSVCAVTGLPG